MKNRQGFSIIEVIFAAAIFVIIASGTVTAVIQGFDMNRNGAENTVATQYATEGMEAMRSLRNQNFTNLTNTASTGILRNGSGIWTLSGANNTFEKYTRAISISDVFRDVSGNIVESGGTIDSLSKKITSTVNWNFTGQRPETLTLTTYLTNWKKAIMGNWATPSQQASLDLSGNNNASKVFVQGNYAYVIRDGGSPNFIIINISNPQAPTISGSMILTNTPTNIYVSGTYAYVSSRDNNAELQIVNIANPSSPAILGTYNAAGTADANAVFVVGNTAYLVRDTSGSPNIYAINVTNKTSLVSLGSVSILGNLEDIYVLGSTAYLASGDNNGELRIVNISNPASMSQIGLLNIAGNNDALSIDGFSNRVLLGQVGGAFSAINITSASSPTLISTLNVGGNVFDMSFDTSYQYAFLATAKSTTEFQVINISNLASMSVFGSLNMANTINGIHYDQNLDRAFVVGIDNAAEFNIIAPN